MQADSPILRDIQDKVLVTLSENNIPYSLLGKGTKSFYVPKTANVHYLRTFINGRFSSSKQSIFLFCYGSTLNNNETMDSIYKKFKSKINDRTGIEIQVAAMSSF